MKTITVTKKGLIIIGDDGSKKFVKCKFCVPEPENIQYEKDILTEEQNYVYKTVVYGQQGDKRLDTPTYRLYLKAQIVINRLKNRRLDEFTKNLLTNLAKGSKCNVWRKIIEFKSDDYPNYMTFRDLNITKEEIIQELIASNVLGPNLFNNFINKTEYEQRIQDDKRGDIIPQIVHQRTG
jgi:hypothetical protein